MGSQMASFNEDEDLKLAIALSLQQDRHTEVIDVDSDEEKTFSNHGDRAKPKIGSPHALGMLGIDRKKMEQERLARKRKPSISPSSPRKAPKLHSVDALKQTQGHDKQVSISTVPESLRAESSVNRSGVPGSSFPSPTVRKTWAFGHARTGDDIKLEEVLQRHDLNLAVLSSFQWDMEWLLAKLNTANTQITLVMQAKEQTIKDQYRRETADMRNLRLCFPPMEGQVNCMHSKLMLLSYTGFLRVVVPTANLVPYDWGESGDMENSVFLVDLPRLPPGQRVVSQYLNAFARELVYFCKAMGLEPSILESLCTFDFSPTNDLGFVHTIGGAHIGSSSLRTGYCGLGKAVRELELHTDAALEMDFVTSSVGSLNTDFLLMLYLAAQGDSGTTEYGWRNPDVGKGKSTKLKGDLEQTNAKRQKVKDEVLDNFHVYFPTHDTVKLSTAGYAGTICFQSKWFNAPTFPRQILRDCKSTRRGLLMHNKIIYVHPKESNRSGSPDSGPRTRPWAYIGSANCSESAWGKLFKDRATKSPKLNCRNWECGVLFPLLVDAETEMRDGLAPFEGTIPVPMQYPGDAYGSRKPWFYSEQ